MSRPLQLLLSALPRLPALARQHPKSLAAGALLAVYLCLVRALRWRRYNAIHRKYGAKFVQDRNSLTPGEAQEIVKVAMSYDMPLLIEYSLAFALFKTYAIPTISKLLWDTRQLSSDANVARRYADTEILIATWMLCPVSAATASKDPRAALAIARTNWLHSKYKIANDDYLYTLGLFMFEPPRWARLYGWRELSAMEQQAIFIFWKDIGEKLNVQDIPSTPEEFKAWIESYEEQYMVPAQSNHDVANHTTNELLFRVPRALGLRAFAEGLTRSILEDRTRIAMMQPAAPAYGAFVLKALMGVVALVNEHLLLPRRKLASVIPYELPEAMSKDHKSAPRFHTSKWTSKPWYKPERGGIYRLFDTFQLWVGWHSDVPRPELKSAGYLIHQLGPVRYEADGREAVFKDAERIQGCPVADVWKSG